MDWIAPDSLFAQTVGASASSGPAAMAYLSLRRWIGGLTLAPARVSPDWSVLGFVGGSLALLLLLAIVFQGPSRTVRQAFDLPGHVQFLRAVGRRLRLSVRMVTTLMACTVISWTLSQSLDFLTRDQDRSRADLLMLLRSRGPVELLAEHGWAAATTPLRDVAGLGDNVFLLVTAFVLLMAARSKFGLGVDSTSRERQWTQAYSAYQKSSAWSLYFLYSLTLYSMYRFFIRITDTGDLPVGNCLGFEVILIPGLMLICDGFLIAWCLAELRDGPLGDDHNGRVDLAPALNLMPIACAACLLVLPARYFATAVLLGTQHLPPSAFSGKWGEALRWSLGPGLVLIQAGSLILVGLLGASAWSSGSLREALPGFGRILAREGGRLAALVATTSMVAGVAASSAYLLLLLLPPAGWVLPAADAYAHYATLPIGLWMLAALVELGERCLPSATLASTKLDSGGSFEVVAEVSPAIEPA